MINNNFKETPEVQRANFLAYLIRPIKLPVLVHINKVESKSLIINCRWCNTFMKAGPNHTPCKVRFLLSNNGYTNELYNNLG